MKDNIASNSSVDQVYCRAGGSSEGGGNLKDKEGVGVALSVENQSPSKLSRSAKGIDSGIQCSLTKVSSRKVLSHGEAGGIVIGSCCISLSLVSNRIVVVDASSI